MPTQAQRWKQPQRKTVRAYRVNRGYRFRLSERQDNGIFVGEFVFLSHPDACPDGEWQYWPKSDAWPQPSYWDILRMTPRETPA